MIKRKYHFIIIVCFSLMLGCKEKVPEGLNLKEKEVVNITKEEQLILDSLLKYKFISTRPLFKEGKDTRQAAIMFNNDLLIQMYQTFIGGNKLFCLKSTRITIEGDQIFRYYITTPGKIIHIADCRLDKFGGKEKVIKQELTFLKLVQESGVNDYQTDTVFHEVDVNNYDKGEKLFLQFFPTGVPREI